MQRGLGGFPHERLHQDSERRLWNKTTTEVRFYISSLENNADKIAKAIRSHWGIENSLH
ncbi:hypothetical protein [Moorena sp. SIO4A5]|uniref:hypothetical protein n=1 Tax=Moorena sp. SIO4A5 TaxID=2607838 RepID=UPI0013C947A8|nr:hypothetical protein [Moorena sp. SIO4A5]NEO21856.1 transposase [Moorena sp. SIO4A5]